MGNCTSCLSSKLVEKEDHGSFPESSLHIVEGDEQLPSSVHSRRGARDVNQDSAVLHQGYLEDGAFCGVFDGHGPNGRIVSTLVRNQLPPLLLQRWRSCMDWQTALVASFEEVDDNIRQLQGLDCSVSGASAVVVIRQGKDLYVANLGDCRAVLGTLTDSRIIQATQLTVDLKPSVEAECDRIISSNGRVFAMGPQQHILRVWLPNEEIPGLAMTRAFGDFDLKNHGVIATPVISQHRLFSNDLFLVLASDGVWDVLSNEEVVETVRQANTGEAAAEAVVDEALAAWKSKFPQSRVDDCSVICLFFKRHAEDRCENEIESEIQRETSSQTV